MAGKIQIEEKRFRNVNFKSIVITIVVSTTVYYFLLYFLIKFETGHEEQNIFNFFDAVWWSVVTITTVGFGDKYPVSDAGRIIGFVFLMISLTFYAILIGRITNLITTILENRKMGFYGMKSTGHAVIIGWSSFGRMVTDQLVAAGKKVAIVTKEKENIDLIREAYSTSEVFTLYTDLANIKILDKVNIGESSIVFVNLEDDTEKLVYILNIKKYYESLRFIVTLDNADLKDTFKSAGVTYAVSKVGLASKLLASYIFEPDVAHYNEEIISFAVTDEHYDMKEFRVVVNNPYLDQYYSKVFFDLKMECNAILVGIVKANEGRKLLKNPEGSVKIEVDDYLLLIANRKAEKKIVKLFGTKEGYDA